MATVFTTRSAQHGLHPLLALQALVGARRILASEFGAQPESAGSAHLHRLLEKIILKGSLR